MKIRPVGAELFHADGQTDRHDEANNRSSQFCDEPTNPTLTAVYCNETRGFPLTAK